MLASGVFRRALVVGLVVVALTVAVLWLVPSDHFILLPDPATPADQVVSVPGERPGEEDGGIYFLEVRVRKATLLERLVPSLHEGSSLVPEEVYNPERLSDRQRRQVSLGEMSAQQQIAITVALRSLGYDVPAGGAEVTSVQPGYPADGKLEVGDVIFAVDGKRVSSPEELRAEMDPIAPGQRVVLRFLRKGSAREVELPTRAAPGDPDRAVFGVGVQPQLEFPLDVRIDAGAVGGPSAGLAFALNVVDELDGDLDKGRKIAVTGELELDGSVRPIGGMKQKAYGAREVGATILIVPERNAAEARRYAGRMTVVSVTSFRQALSYLKTG